MAVPHSGAPATLPVTADAALRNLSATSGRFKGEPTFDVMSYGAVGDGATDDTVAVQAAITAAAASGGIVNGSSRRYKVTSTLNLASNVRVRDMTIDASAMTTAQSILRGVGTADAAVLLAGDAAQGATTLTVVSSDGIAVNDWLLLSSTELFGSTSQPAGEIVRVSAVSGMTVTLYDPTADGYTVANGAQIEKLNFVENVRIERVHVLGPADNTLSITGLYLDKCRDVQVSDSTFSRTHWNGIALRDCIGSRVVGCHFNLIEKEGLAYGIAVLWASQDISIAACTAHRMRPLVSVGGGEGRPGVPRRVAVTGCIVSQSMASGFNAHPVGEDISFVGNHVYGSDATGITYQAASGVIANNTIRNTATSGINIQPLTVGPHDIIVEGNRVRNAGTVGILFLTSASWPNAGGITIATNSVDGAGTNGIDIDCSSSAISGANVSGNRVRASAAQSMNIRGVAMAVVSGNVIHHSGTGSPIRLWSVSDSTINGNAITSTVSVHGIITVSPVTKCAFTGNRVTGCNSGIRLVSGANDNIATVNQLQGNTSGIVNLGTGNTVTGNLT